MAFTLNGAPLQRATVTVPRTGLWLADEVGVAGELAPLAEGARVILQIGTLTLSGTVVPGTSGTFLSEATYTIIAGAGGWAKDLPAKAYRSDGGVQLLAVVADLARETGELVDLTTVPARSLGYAWTRPAGLASVVMDALFPPELGGWRVDPDGLARPGVRPAAAIPPSVVYVVSGYDTTTHRATVELELDDVAPFLPGAIVTYSTLPGPLLVGTTVLRVSPERVALEVMGEQGPVELVAQVVNALTARDRIFGAEWPYQVEADPAGRSSLRSLAAGMPDLLAIDKIPGIPGVSSVLQPRAVVLVAFQGSDPGRPYVSRYLGGVLPLSVQHNAQTSITLGTLGAVSPAARADKTDLALSALLVGVNAALAALHLPAVPAPASTAAGKVLIE